jgi:hypothetical protein
VSNGGQQLVLVHIASAAIQALTQSALAEDILIELLGAAVGVLPMLVDFGFGGIFREQKTAR